MDPAEYVPEYDDSVIEFFSDKPEVGVWPISERYCLQPASAVVLASLFDPKPQVIEDWPTRQAPGSPFTYNHPVPWLLFPDGTRRNAAVLAGYWGMPGVPRSQALMYAKLDVATPVEA